MKQDVFFGFDKNDFNIIKNMFEEYKKIEWIDLFSMYNNFNDLKNDESTIKKRIKENLNNTTKTIIFIWKNTLNLSYIHYIIKESEKKNNIIIWIRLYSSDWKLLIWKNAHSIIKSREWKNEYFDDVYQVYDYKEKWYSNIQECLRQFI